MKLVTYLLPHDPQHARLGALLADAVVDIGTACTWAQGACGIAREDLPDSLLELIYAGESAWDYTRRVVDEVEKTGQPLLLKGRGHQPVAHRRESARLLAPLRPVTLRDAYAFEQHVRTANENRGRTVPEEWYRFPVFYYTNPHTIFGPGDAVPRPAYTTALDYELEIAAVVGRPGINLGSEEAAGHIFGFTIFNDWSARDVQRVEMKAGLGPAKGKDFASSLGPCIITLDELADRATGRPGVYDLAMQARLNAVTRSQGNFKDIYWSFGDILARISDSAPLYPGDVVGSGTVGGGCLLELTRAEGPWLQPGDTIELEIERIGILRNTIRG